MARSSFSGATSGNCVECAPLGGATGARPRTAATPVVIASRIAVRDSRNPQLAARLHREPGRLSAVRAGALTAGLSLLRPVVVGSSGLVNGPLAKGHLSSDSGAPSERAKSERFFVDP
ncbi:DUF397 domain-containing protein [Streptomyces avidinii]